MLSHHRRRRGSLGFRSVGLLIFKASLATALHHATHHGPEGGRMLLSCWFSQKVSKGSLAMEWRRKKRKKK
uniref:Putative secreted peptide n=1 Tax=Anopheles braziliensis TaxID=58242 RepID=A0A2M3ZVF9_9DIPT